MIEYIQHKVYRSGTTSMRFLDEPYKIVGSGVKFLRSSALVEVFNEMLAKMEPNGLMEYWRRLRSFSTTKIEEIGPQVLTMDHLRIGFLACCITMILAVIVFIGELARSRFATFSGENSDVSKKSSNKVNCDVVIFSSEFNRTQTQATFVKPQELTIHGITVEKIHQEARIDWQDLIKTCDDDSKDPENNSNSDAKMLTSDFRQTLPQQKEVEPIELTETHVDAVEEIHQETRTGWEDLIKSNDDDDLLRSCQELCDDIDHLANKSVFTTTSKKV